MLQVSFYFEELKCEGFPLFCVNELMSAQKSSVSAALHRVAWFCFCFCFVRLPMISHVLHS